MTELSQSARTVLKTLQERPDLDTPDLIYNHMIATNPLLLQVQQVGIDTVVDDLHELAAAGLATAQLGRWRLTPAGQEDIT